MRRNTTRIALVLLLIAGLGFGAVGPGAEAKKKRRRPRPEPIELVCGLVINEPGRYVATRSTTNNCTDGVIVAIAASNVRLGLRGRTIDGDGTNNACIGVSGTPAKQNIKITGGHVRDCIIGVGIASGVSGARIAKMTAIDNLIGVAPGGGGTVVKRNTIVGSDFGVGPATSGASVAAAENSTIAKNTLAGNSLGVDVGDGNTIRRNTVVGNATGIRIQDGNRVEGNSATGNTAHGVKVEGEGNVLKQNDASANTADGFEVDQADNKLSRNTARDNRDRGIHAQPGTQGKKNKASGNVLEDCTPQSLCS